MESCPVGPPQRRPNHRDIDCLASGLQVLGNKLHRLVDIASGTWGEKRRSVMCPQLLNGPAPGLRTSASLMAKLALTISIPRITEVRSANGAHLSALSVLTLERAARPVLFLPRSGPPPLHFLCAEDDARTQRAKGDVGAPRWAVPFAQLCPQIPPHPPQGGVGVCPRGSLVCVQPKKATGQLAAYDIAHCASTEGGQLYAKKKRRQQREAALAANCERLSCLGRVGGMNVCLLYDCWP